MESERLLKVTVQVDINTKKILDAHKMGGDNKAQIYLASEVKRLCDPYVPMQSEYLKNHAVIANDGSSITYIAPYAHYQYKGKVMGPNYMDDDGDWHSGKAPKHYTGKDLTYNGAPMRGPEWDKRMLADTKDELVNNLRVYIGG